MNKGRVPHLMNIYYMSCKFSGTTHRPPPHSRTHAHNTHTHILHAWSHLTHNF